MLESCKNAQERWGGVNLLIDRWLAERHELVKSFDSLQGQETTPESFQRFCEILVDYVSAGHFEIYEQLIGEAREFNDARGLELAERIYPRLEAITEVALAFNDRCANGDCLAESGLELDLKRLSQLMHERFELEDCLIEVLHNAHQQIAPAV